MAQMRLARYGGGIWCIKNGVVDSRFTYTSTAQATADGLGWNNLNTSNNDTQRFSLIANMKFNNNILVNKYKYVYVKFKLYTTSTYASQRKTVAFTYRQLGTGASMWASNVYLTQYQWKEMEATFSTTNMSISSNGFYHYLWNETTSAIRYNFYITDLKFYN